jgi:hypothetical protein
MTSGRPAYALSSVEVFLGTSKALAAFLRKRYFGSCTEPYYTQRFAEKCDADNCGNRYEELYQQFKSGVIEEADLRQQVKDLLWLVNPREGKALINRYMSGN